MSDNNESDLPCNPASPRRLLVSGPVSEKLVTEDCGGVGTQAPSPVNATGQKAVKSIKKLTQQAFHPGLFTRARSASLSSMSDAQTQNQVQNSKKTEHSPNVNPPTWQRVPTLRGAKRKQVSSPSPERIAVKNRFLGLPTDEQEKDDVPVPQRKSKPPSIILYGIEDVNKLTELLERVVNTNDFTYKIVNKNQLRIVCNTAETYKKIIDTVREKGLIGHTFNMKNKRPYRIVIRNLHHTTPIDVIKDTLEKTGNTVIGEIINAKFGPEKKPTSTFFATLEQGPNNKTVKDLKYIHHQSIIIEDPRKRNTVVQCQRCQQYGHTKNYCMRPYRCVKCADSHRTADCPKSERISPAKCALCLGSHPANYKGCEVYKEILARKQNKQANVKQRHNEQKVIDLTSEFPPLKGKSDKDKPKVYRDRRQKYAEVLKTNKRDKSDDEETHNKLEEILLKQAEKIELLLQQMGTLISLITTIVSKISK